MKRKILADKARFILDICKVLVCFPLGYLLYWLKDIYIISERGTDARDNGYHMFKYITQNHPAENVYYIIDKHSADYEKVAKLGRVIHYKSWKHALYFIAARRKISTHILGYAPGTPYRYQKLQKYLKVPGKHIFLQHGITCNDVAGLYADKAHLNLFVCGAKPESEYIASHFGHPEGVVCYTGFARYDNLYGHKAKREILVMPTWRMYLQFLSDAEFMNTDYYLHWNEVLQNPRLHTYLQERGVKLVFYPHYEMQRYIHCFQVENENVVIADFGKYDVQQLLIDGSLLVTDYSSVFFDFAYMQKPCVYYQFDREEFYLQHYQKGYFDYCENGFGEVVTDIDGLLNALRQIIDQEFSMEEKYRKRTDGFFELRDNHNCERIYKAIEALK